MTMPQRSLSRSLLKVVIDRHGRPYFVTGPMLGAQRRIEARIGQLLGEAPGYGRSEINTHADSVDRTGDRADFRILARGFDVLTERIAR
jgi:hypothetical protein